MSEKVLLDVNPKYKKGDCVYSVTKRDNHIEVYKYKIIRPVIEINMLGKNKKEIVVNYAVCNYITGRENFLNKEEKYLYSESDIQKKIGKLF